MKKQQRHEYNLTADEYALLLKAKGDLAQRAKEEDDNKQQEKIVRVTRKAYDKINKLQRKLEDTIPGYYAEDQMNWSDVQTDIKILSKDLIKMRALIFNLEAAVGELANIKEPK